MFTSARSRRCPFASVWLAFAVGLALLGGAVASATGGAFITSFTPAGGYPGTQVTLIGGGFSGAPAVTGVFFNGCPAVRYEDYAYDHTLLTAIVPLDATAGPITVTFADGSSAVSADLYTPLPTAAGRIVYSSPRYSSGNTKYYLYAVNPDGSGLTRLTGTGNDMDPAFSPDGRKIVYYTDRASGPGIHVMNADGSGDLRLTSVAANEMYPVFSPDGQKIAFMSDRDGNPEIYLMNLDGSGVTRLTEDPAGDRDPAFSPDGQTIAFATDRSGYTNICTMKIDGTGVTPITFDTGYNTQPSFSPDGTTIVFASSRDGGNPEVYLMNVDGSNPRRLTNNIDDVDYMPCFSPDGQHITFSSYREESYAIYVMNADGSGQTRISFNPDGSDYYPAWGVGVTTPLTGVWVTPHPGNIALTGHAQTWTATPAGGAHPEYSFTVKLKDVQPGGGYLWTTVYADAAYSDSPGRVFTPADPGSYTVTVSCRETGTAAPVYTAAKSVVIGTETLTGVALAANMTSGVAVSDIPAAGIRLTATPSGTGAGAQYFFSATLRDLDAAGAAVSVPVTLSGAWGGPTFQWHPTEPGYYTLRVTARDATCNISYTAYLTFLVRSGALKGLVFSASPSSATSALNVLPAGGITLTGTPTGTGTGVEYFFSGVRTMTADYTSVNEPVVMSTAWSTVKSFAWHPGEAGTYLLTLTARDATCNTSITKTMTYVLRLAKLTGIASFTADPPSGLLETDVPAGGIALAAAAAPANAGVEYFFAAKRRVYGTDGSFTDTPVTLSAAWQAGGTYAWHPSRPGMYLLTVTARDKIFANTAKSTISFLVKPTSLTGIADLSAMPASGTSDNLLPPGGISLLAIPQGTGAGARYFFSAKLKDIAADGSYVMTPVTLSTAWSTDQLFAWHPTAPGTYTVTVTAKDADGLVTFSKTLSYLLKSATVTGIFLFTPGTPGGAALADLPAGGVVFTTIVSGAGSGVRYRYRVDTWNGTAYAAGTLTDDTASNIFLFAPSSSGTYRLWVYAYDSTYNTSYYKYTAYVVN